MSADKSYVLQLSGKDANGNDFNSANKNFKNESTTSMRVWLRMAVTVVPILFIGAALLIQHKKFVITEDYYDMMLVEIDKRKQSGGEQSEAEQPESGEPEQPTEE